MDADDVIESYVHDVARRLPHRRRDDVAFELRALLTDDLRARTEDGHRQPDGALAEEMLRAFGSPAETAARYAPPFTIIEPSDTWGFFVAAAIGGTAISLLAQPGPAGSDRAGTDPTPAILAWIGLLVIVFAAKNLIRRHRPDAFRWRPRPVNDADAVHRVGTAALALLFAGLLVLYCAPGPVVEAFSGGRVAAGRLTYSDSFTDPLRWSWLIAILAAAIGLHVLVTVQGRWHRYLRWTQIVLMLQFGIQLGWHIRYGNVFQDPETDRLLFPAIDAVAAIFWLAAGVAFYREWNRVRPAPAATTDLSAA